MIGLNDFQRDALGELLNIGMGAAAASLSEMVGENVNLSVPSVEVIARKDEVERIRDMVGDTISAVREEFGGALWGDALLIFPEQKSLELVQVLLHEEMSLDSLAEMGKEVLTEIGNIILNACLGTLADVFAEELTYNLPSFDHGQCGKVLKLRETSPDNNDIVMLLRTDFVLEKSNIDGYLILLMDVESVQAFSGHIQRLVDGGG